MKTVKLKDLPFGQLFTYWGIEFVKNYPSELHHELINCRINNTLGTVFIGAIAEVEVKEEEV